MLEGSLDWEIDGDRKTMELVPVAKIEEFAEHKPVYFVPPGKSALKIAIYRHKENYYAYLDHCPHQQGPACEGIVVGNTEGEIMPDGKVRKYSSEDNFNIACPWHGVEFDLFTGICKANRRDRLRSYEVVVEDGLVKVKL
jgi:nitrite reductase (NADH) small subunit